MDPKCLEEKVAANQSINQPNITYPDRTPQEIGILPSDGDPITHRRRSRRRRAAVFLTSVTLWIVYIIFLRMTERRGSGGDCNGPKAFESPITSGIEWSVPSDINIDDCASLAQDSITAVNLLRGRLSSSAVLELPITSENIFLLARGASAGVVHVIQSDEAGGNIKVQVVARYKHDSALSQVRVCAISRHGNQRGIGIISPQFGGRVGIHYDITVRLPSASKGSPLHIKNFETDLPLFAHNIGKLAEAVHFDTLSLRTSMMDINVGSLSVTSARIETMNAKIEGTFYTSSVLELATYNAPIKVNVGLTNGRNSPATRLAMSTTNAAVTARMSLVSGMGVGGQFKVSGLTSSGPMDLAFTEAPIGSSLLLNAQTSFAPANVRLHSTYEGEFRVITSTKQAILSVDRGVVDPAGRGRRRAVELYQAGMSYTSGSVSWAPEGKRLGSVNVETSLAPAALRV